MHRNYLINEISFNRISQPYSWRDALLLVFAYFDFVSAIGTSEKE